MNQYGTVFSYESISDWKWNPEAEACILGSDEEVIMMKYNIYSVEWKYLGCFWTGNPYFEHNEVGDYILTKYAGPALTEADQELPEIEPIDCFVKLVDAAETQNR
jgi:hypothetical protein